MSDRGKIIGGLVVFLLLVTFPLWHSLAAGDGADMPELEYPEGETACIEDAEYMRANHMHILNEWRNDVVRKGIDEYTSSSGETFKISLTKTCMNCHDNRDTFCTRCHDYSDVSPICWNCHVEPRGN